MMKKVFFILLSCISISYSMQNHTTSDSLETIVNGTATEFEQLLAEEHLSSNVVGQKNIYEYIETHDKPIVDKEQKIDTILRYYPNIVKYSMQLEGPCQCSIL